MGTLCSLKGEGQHWHPPDHASGPAHAFEKSSAEGSGHDSAPAATAPTRGRVITNPPLPGSPEAGGR